jgi:hypothetical protein
VKSLALCATLALALAVRLPGISWGLPPATQQVRASDFRSSYAFDEDDILSGAAKASVARLDFDPHEYHWGTLHIELVLLALDGTQALRAFSVPWRTAYYNLVKGDFDRVYVVGRLVAVAAALLTIFFLWLIPNGGALAAILIAVSPAHVLQSDQVRVDVTMTAMLALTLLLAMRFSAAMSPRQSLFLGFAAGLAVAGKYSAISAAGTIVIAALILARSRLIGWLSTVSGSVLGFIAGSPYIVIKPRSFSAEIHRYVSQNNQIPSEFLIAPARLLELHLINLVRFSLGVPAFLLACAGLIWMVRRRSPADWIILAGLAGYVAILFPLRWALIRYDLPLAMLLGFCAGVALNGLPQHWRFPVAAIAIVMPLAGCIAQIHYMRAPHPANVILARILETVPPGTPISRLLREAPPLNLTTYPMGQNMLLDDLVETPPLWVLASDLPDVPYKPSTLSLLRSSYDEVANACIQPILSWSTLGASPAPHDWKYTHATYTLYRRRAP